MAPSSQHDCLPPPAEAAARCMVATSASAANEIADCGVLHCAGPAERRRSEPASPAQERVPTGIRPALRLGSGPPAVAVSHVIHSRFSTVGHRVSVLVFGTLSTVYARVAINLSMTTSTRNASTLVGPHLQRAMRVRTLTVSPRRLRKATPAGCRALRSSSTRARGSLRWRCSRAFQQSTRMLEGRRRRRLSSRLCAPVLLSKVVVRWRVP